MTGTDRQHKIQPRGIHDPADAGERAESGGRAAEVERAVEGQRPGIVGDTTELQGACSLVCERSGATEEIGDLNGGRAVENQAVVILNRTGS